MKKILIICSIFLGVILLNFGADWLLNRPVSTKHLNEKIAEVKADLKARFDSLNVRVDSLFNLTEEIKSEVTETKETARENGAKLDSLRKDVKEVKSATSRIEFKLF